MESIEDTIRRIVREELERALSLNVSVVELDPPAAPPDLLTIEMVSKMLGYSRGTLANWRVLNSKGVEIGPKWFKLTPRIVRYRAADVEAWISDHHDDR